MTRSKLFLLAATCVATLSSCGDSDTATAPGEGPSVPFGTAAVGTWTAEKALDIDQGSLKGSASAVVVTAILPDSTFAGSLSMKNVTVTGSKFGDVKGELYRRAGSWTLLGDSAIVLTPTTCSQSQSAVIPLVGMMAPFKFDDQGALAANPHESVVCGSPDTLRTKPAGNTWTVPFQANLPAPIGAGTWLLTFTR